MRRNQNVLNMVAAMVVVMLGVGAVYFATMRTDGDQVQPFDFASQLSLARAQATSFTPVRPIPTIRWTVTAATFTRDAGVEHWRVGVRLPSGRFAWIEQVDGSIEEYLAQWSKGGTSVGSIEVLGVPRQHWVSGSWHALTFADEGVALGVFGSAPVDELVELAQSLSGS
jgi:hypothetical protein